MKFVVNSLARPNSVHAFWSIGKVHTRGHSSLFFFSFLSYKQYRKKRDGGYKQEERKENKGDRAIGNITIRKL
jgi:hypothetical protein